MSTSIYAQLDSRIRSIVDAIADWTLAHELYTDRADALKKAIVSVTYSDWCSLPSATDDQIVLSSELLSIFFYFDDLAKAESELFQRQVRALFSDQLPSVRPKPIAALEHYLGHLARYGDPQPLRDRLLRSFEHFSSEHALEAGQRWSVSDVDRIRMGSVFVEEYNINWKIAMGIMGITGHRRSEEMSARLIYLVNDIASIEKDTHSPEANYVIALHHEEGLSIAAAAKAVTRMVQDYYRTLQRELAQDPQNALLQYLCTIVEGNIFATIELSKIRYGKLPEDLVRCCQVLSPDGRSSRWVDYASYFEHEAHADEDPITPP